MKKIVLLACFLTLFTCEKDDICPESTPTTPQLVVRFYDALSPTNFKPVTSLLVYGLNDDDEVVTFHNISVSTTDSIAVPLRANNDATKLVFHKDYSINNNGTPTDTSDDFVEGNPDTIDLNYTRSDVYVSRACGYKTIFNDLSRTLQADADNWITNTTLNTTTIDNENTAHVKIYH